MARPAWIRRRSGRPWRRALPSAGGAPPGRVCEGGAIPPEFPLTETHRERSERAPDVPRSLRTEWNARDSDGTCIILASPRKRTKNHPACAGTRWTAVCAVRFEKPLMTIGADDRDAAARIADWVERLNILTLNAAGPSEKTSPGIGGKTLDIVTDVISIVRIEKKRPKKTGARTKNRRLFPFPRRLPMSPCFPNHSNTPG
uniref:Molybdenum carrier n=1 Tax=Candidatus Kentrum sp. DK TaxID=2126562 RepID=A0A450SH13_9GAMM|nr:MAG: Putative molybdenum carrier [Candidatus Kentron sp. DK]